MPQLLKKFRKFFEKYSVFIVFLFLFTVSLIVSLSISTPIIPSDEAYYMYYARCFSGIIDNCSLFGAPYGFSLFVVPLMWIKNPLILFKMVLFLNTLFSSLVFIFVYFIVSKLEKFKKSENILIAFLVSLYPQIFMSGNIMMSEALFILNSVVVIFFLIKVFDSKKKHVWYNYFLFGFFSAYAFLIRGNSLVLLCASIILLLFLFCKLRYRKILFGFLGIFVLLGLHLFIKLYFFSFTDDYALNATTLLLFKSRTFIEFFRVLGGHIFYNFLSTFLISFFSIVFLFKLLKERFFIGKVDYKKYILFFMLFVFFSNFILLVLGNTSDYMYHRMDSYFFGRYIEGFIVFSLIPGLIYLFSKKSTWRWFNYSFFVLLFLFCISFFYLFLMKLRFVEFSILNFTPLYNLFGEMSFVKIFLFFFPFILLLYFGLKYSKKVFLILLISFYVLLNFFIYNLYYQRSFDSLYQYRNYYELSVFNDLDDYPIYFDFKFYHEYSYSIYRFLFPDFDKFSLSRWLDCDSISDGIIFTRKKDFLDYCPDAKLIIYENHKDIAAYTLSNEIYNELRDRNLVFENVPDRLTDINSRIELLGRYKKWGNDYLKIRVYNDSSQPWLNWWGLQYTEYKNPVRLGMLWLDENGDIVKEERMELLRTIFPREYVDFDIKIEEPFSNKLRVSMVQDGHVWFYSVDSSQQLEFEFD